MRLDMFWSRKDVLHNLKHHSSEPEVEVIHNVTVLFIILQIQM